MTPQQANQLIEIIKEIIPPLYREMGEKWCSYMFDKLNKLQKEISITQQLENE